MRTRFAGEYLKEMVEVMAPRLGRDEATRNVARMTGLSYWPAARLITGHVKTVTTDRFVRIRAAYLDWCLGEIRRMQTNMEEAQDNDLLEDLENEVLALREKVRQARKRMN